MDNANPVKGLNFDLDREDLLRARTPSHIHIFSAAFLSVDHIRTVAFVYGNSFAFRHEPDDIF